MRKIFLPLIVLILIFAAGCNRHTHNSEAQIQNFLSPDSVWVNSGDLHLDSLLQKAATAPIDTNLAKLYHEIGERFEDLDVEKAKTYYLKLDNLSEYLNWSEGRYHFATAYSNLLIRKGRLDTALMVLEKGYNLAVQQNNETATADMLFNQGNVFFMKEWFQQALTCYSDAFAIYEKKNDIDKCQTIYWLMTVIYQTIGNIDKAVECGEKSIALNNENPYSFLCLAIAYQAANQREKSIANYEEALRLATLQGNIYLQGTIYNYFANEALLTVDLERAEKFAHKSLEFNRIFGPAWCATCYVVLSKVEELRNNTDKSEEYTKVAQQIAEELNALEEKKLSFIFLSELCFAHRKYCDHSKYYVEWDMFDITRVVGMTYRASEEMFANYILSKKDFEIERQHTIIEKQNLQRGLLVGGIATCVVVLALLWYMLRLRSRRNSALQEKTEILAEMNATKNKFFSVISHDLKNPAITLRDALQILLTNAHSWDPDTLNKYCIELFKSAENHIELIYSLLNWAQIQTGRLSFTPVSFFLPKLLPEISIIRKMAENKEISLNISIPEEAVVSCDVNMLLTVVRNLLTNAVKFTPKGGTVQLDVSPCRDAMNRVSPKYTISITDTGIGMRKEQITKLFQLDSLHSQKGTNGEEGSGLGLIICKEFLEKHNSTLHIESEVGKGSRVWFEI